MSSPAPDRLGAVALCAALSGAGAVATEVGWAQGLGLVLGHGPVPVALATAVLLAGWAAGSFAALVLLRRVRRPRRIYALLEFTAVAAGAGVAALLPRLGGFLARLPSAGFEALPPAAPRALAAGALLLTPALLLGASLPILAAASSTRADAGRRAGRLAAWNAAGGAIGALAAVFLLLPGLGTRLTLACALVAHGAAGLLVLVRRRAGPSAEPASRAPAVEARPGHRNPRFAAALLLGGAASLATQIAWTRVLSWQFGSTVHVFGLLLAVSIAGLALGGLLVTRAAAPAPPAWAALQTAAAACVLLGCLAAPALPPLIAQAAAAGPPALIGAQIGMALLVIGAPMLCWGAAFPIACRRRAALGPGRELGLVGGWVTAGNVLGALVAGLGPAPARSLLLAAAGLALVAAGLAGSERDADRARLRRRHPWLWATAVALLLGLPALARAWEPAILGSGPVLHARHYVAAAALRGVGVATAMRERAPVLFHAEGADGLVTLRRQPSGEVSLQVNGRTEASTGADMRSQVLAAAIPLAHRARVRRALLIGLASGVTAGSLLPRVEDELVVAEIAPTIVRAAAAGWFDAAAGAPLLDPRLRLRLEDGRAVLQYDPRRFDLIVSQPSQPWVAGVAALYTEEFFSLARARLDADGVIGVWLQAQDLPLRAVRDIVRTFLRCFPSAALFEESPGGGDYFLVGSPARLEDDPLRLAERLGPAQRADLARVGVASPGALLARGLLRSEALAAFAGPGPLLRDDDLRLSYDTPRRLDESTAIEIAAAIEAARPPAPRPAADPGALAPAAARLAADQAAAERARRTDLQVLALVNRADLAALGDPVVAEALALARAGLFGAAYRTLASRLPAAGDPALQTLAGDLALRQREPGLARVHFAAALATEPRSLPALVGAGLAAFEDGAYPDAEAMLTAALAVDARSAPALAALGGLRLLERRDPEARDLLLRAVDADPDLPAAWINLGAAQRRAGDTPSAERSYRRALELDPAAARAWLNLGTLLTTQGRTRDAAAALRQGLQVAPGDADLIAALERLNPPRR